MMEFRIESIEDVKVVGMRALMSISTINAETGNLARRFMPRRYEVVSRIEKHVYSIQNYGPDFDSMPETKFEKWIGIEVSDFQDIPPEMETFILKGGPYAVFDFKGAIQDFPKSRQYIFNEWLPNSGYNLDPRPHFEILSENYSRDLQNIEEEVWVPVKPKV